MRKPVVVLVALLVFGLPSVANGQGAGVDFMGGLPMINGSTALTDGSSATVGPPGINSRAAAVAAGQGWEFSPARKICSAMFRFATPGPTGSKVYFSYGSYEASAPADDPSGQWLGLLDGAPVAAADMYVWYDAGVELAEVYSFETYEGGGCEPPDEGPPSEGNGWLRDPPSGSGPISTPPTGTGDCEDPWRRDPRTGYCYDWFGRTQNSIGDNGLWANPSGTTWDGTTATWVGIGNIDYYTVEYWVEDEPEPWTWPRLVAGCEAIPGSWSSGAVLGCLVTDKDNLVGRRYTVRVAAWRGGHVVADSTFTVEGAKHVELGYYTMQKFDRWFQDLLDALLVDDVASKQALQQIENAVNRLQNWGPFGAGQQAADAVSGMVGAIQSGSHVPLEAQKCGGTDALWCFPIRLDFTGHEFALELPMDEILAVPEWEAVWKVISAGMWVAFGVWVLYRVAPGLSA